MGARLGMLELQLILAMTLQRFEISVDPELEPGREALISLRPTPDIALQLRRRH
jgi:cytochrome P450